MESLLTAKEIMQRWKVSRATIYRIIDKGDLKVYKIGSSLRFDPESVRNYEEGVMGWSIDSSREKEESGMSNGKRESHGETHSRQFVNGFQRGRMTKRRLKSSSMGSSMAPQM